METTKFRHEVKHYINILDYYVMKNRFKAVMKADVHGNENNEYTIRSIYFDDFYDNALYQKISGVDNREKFRIRLYNNDTSFIRLEKKQKCCNRTAKFSAIITKEQCEMLLRDDIDWMKKSDIPLLKEFYVKVQSCLLKPKTIVDYVREAYTYPVCRVRVTFDKSVKTGLFSRNLFDINLPVIKTLGKELIILEVKYDEFLPEIIRDILQTNLRRQVSVSKYTLCRNFG